MRKTKIKRQSVYPKWQSRQDIMNYLITSECSQWRTSVRLVLLIIDINRLISVLHTNAELLWPHTQSTDSSKKTPVCMINVALPLQHQVWRCEWCANQTYHCLTLSPSVFAGKNVLAYRDCSQDIRVVENEVTNVTSTILWQQIQLYYSTIAVYCIFLYSKLIRQQDYKV